MNLLIIKIGALGDNVMALSMLRASQEKWPGAKVTWVCGESVAPLMKVSKGIDELIVINDRRLLKGGVLGALIVLVPLWFRFLGRKFDLIVTGHSDKRYGWLSLTTWGATHREFGEGEEGRWPVPGRYHADEYARLITGENGPSAVKGMVPVLEAELPTELSRKLDRNKKIVALAPGGAKNLLRDDALRRWPVENYVQLAEKLVRAGHQVIITGSVSDEWVRDFFKSAPVVDLIGQTSVTDLVALYRNSNVTVTHDSGPLHLAVASGSSVIALFGPTNPWEKVPCQEKVTVLWGGKELACRPCYDGKNYAKCTDNQCLKRTSVDQVHEAVLKSLKSASKS